jgi:hypothetical protein
MTGTTRINPDSGVVEEQNGFIDKVIDHWEPKEDEDGTRTRVNPESGVIEEQSGFINKVLDLWEPKED